MFQYASLSYFGPVIFVSYIYQKFLALLAKTWREYFNVSCQNKITETSTKTSDKRLIRIYEGIEAKTRKSEASFQII